MKIDGYLPLMFDDIKKENGKNETQQKSVVVDTFGGEKRD